MPPTPAASRPRSVRWRCRRGTLAASTRPCAPPPRSIRRQGAIDAKDVQPVLRLPALGGRRRLHSDPAVRVPARCGRATAARLCCRSSPREGISPAGFETAVAPHGVDGRSQMPRPLIHNDSSGQIVRKRTDRASAAAWRRHHGSPAGSTGPAFKPVLAMPGAYAAMAEVRGAALAAPAPDGTLRCGRPRRRPGPRSSNDSNAPCGGPADRPRPPPREAGRRRRPRRPVAPAARVRPGPSAKRISTPGQRPAWRRAPGFPGPAPACPAREIVDALRKMFL